LEAEDVMLAVEVEAGRRGGWMRGMREVTASGWSMGGILGMSRGAEYWGSEQCGRAVVVVGCLLARRVVVVVVVVVWR
jgi:hypothetical protein